jgi:aspartyl-tRNA(Asn)/glutamyl-tRNA(Gln) amidotransferase subunit B
MEYDNKYELVVGMEIHSELKTRTKIFCRCKNEFGGEPNTRCCPICLGMPGTLPSLNKKALEFAIKAGLAINCEILEFSKMDRKNYFYPDMPKAYQISQYDLPICRNGYVDIEIDDQMKRIGIERIHIEEDAGKLIHHPSGEGSLIDYNRCGVPLIEIVTCPDIRSAEEAKILLETIKSILEYTGVSDCRMQEGSLRADVNISMRPKGEKALGIRTEMKNINSIRAVFRAIKSEAKRQAQILDRGGTIKQETRRWDDIKGESFPMRSKEESMDYRYFPEPDIVPVVVNKSWIESIRADMPELALNRKHRYINELCIPEYDAGVITNDKRVADIFETASNICGNPKLVSNWIMTDLLRLVNEQGEKVLASGLDGIKLGEILVYLQNGEITTASAKRIMEEIVITGETPKQVIERLSLKVQRDGNVIITAVKKAIDQNQSAVEDFLTGKTKAFGFLMGKAMKNLDGKGDPSQVRNILYKELELRKK